MHWFQSVDSADKCFPGMMGRAYVRITEDRAVYTVSRDAARSGFRNEYTALLTVSGLLRTLAGLLRKGARAGRFFN
jgi:hypothetical protein